MVRGFFLVLFCSLVLVFAAPLGHADGGAPDAESTAPSSSGSTTVEASSSDGQVVSNPFLFIDVPAEHWAVEDLKYLVEYGVITGLPNGAFNGDKALTRYSAAAMVARALRLMENNPNLVTKADLNALQELLFQMSDQIEQNRTQIEFSPSGGGANGSGLAATLKQTSERLGQAEALMLAMQQEMNQLKRDLNAPQRSSVQINQIRQQVNANFIIAIASVFVGIIAIALATMT